MSLLKHPKLFILLFHVIVSYGNPASNFGPPYCTDIALLSHPYMVILLPYMAGGGGRGGQPDLKRKNVHHVRNFISATPLIKHLINERIQDLLQLFSCLLMVLVTIGNMLLGCNNLNSLFEDKEQWEPTLAKLFQLSDSKASPVLLKEAWCLDCPDHGETSASFNAAELERCPRFICTESLSFLHRYTLIINKHVMTLDNS